MRLRAAFHLKGLVIFSLFMFIYAPVFSQTVEQVEKAESDILKDKQLRERIEEQKKKPEIEDKMPMPAGGMTGEQKVLIKEINVTGSTILEKEEINKITLPYKNKELTLRELQRVADLITDAYRKKGYVTSRAYIPPQKIQKGVLEISVVEGITGNIDVKGNRYFKSRILKNKIALKKGESFDYEALRKGLSKINQLPDRNAKAVLVPGKEPGTTDIVLEVKDNLPIHVGFDWDNFGSSYIDHNRLKTTVTHNNFLGLDDILALQYQLSEGENYRLLTLRYLIPVTKTLQLGFFAAESKIRLMRDYEDLTARGKSKLYSVYAIQSLIDKENTSLNLNLGFDYKDVFNFQSGVETSRDRVRVAKAGLDFDSTDSLGRTIVTNEVDFGIPDIMGGLRDQDSHSSRSGAGGKFVKDVLNILRLQRMPFNSTLLWKNQLQFSPYILPATEQFQIGGIVNVRGYPPAEAVGDRGYSMTWEWSVPPYFVPKNINVPFSKARVYDALRFVAFYDWANVRLRRPTAGTEEKDKTLRSIGCGVRLNLPEDFSVRAEFAWPLDNTPSDGDHLHTWLEVSKTF